MERHSMILVWPDEKISCNENPPKWGHAGSNLCLDFHGDPSSAELVIFSDGNHHMALAEALQSFCKQHPDLKHIFYATTPPGPILQLLKHGSLQIGNLFLSVKPHVFISPPHVGLIGYGGRWGPKLIEFLLSDTVRDIYTSHGLLQINK